MDVRTRLENEELFCIGNNGKNRVLAVNKKGIYTVEDFLNCDIDSLNSRNKQYRILRDVLSCKYLNKPLVRSVCLNKAVPKENIDDRGYHYLADIMYNELGFSGFPNDIRKMLADFCNNDLKDGIKMIDVLRHISANDKYAYKPLIDFYISYYDKNAEKEATMPENSDDIKKAKDEITFLMELRDKLDSRILELNSQINIEKRSGFNGRK